MLYCIHLTVFFSRTTWVSQHQKGKPFCILIKQEKIGWQWHQLDHVQIICTSLQTDNHDSTSPLSFTGQMPFLPYNLQHQIIECLHSLCILFHHIIAQLKFTSTSKSTSYFIKILMTSTCPFCEAACRAVCPA